MSEEPAELLDEEHLGLLDGPVAAGIPAPELAPLERQPDVRLPEVADLGLDLDDGRQPDLRAADCDVQRQPRRSRPLSSPDTRRCRPPWPIVGTCVRRRAKCCMDAHSVSYNSLQLGVNVAPCQPVRTNTRQGATGVYQRTREIASRSFATGPTALMSSTMSFSVSGDRRLRCLDNVPPRWPSLRARALRCPERPIRSGSYASRSAPGVLAPLASRLPATCGAHRCNTPVHSRVAVIREYSLMLPIAPYCSLMLSVDLYCLPSPAFGFPSSPRRLPAQMSAS